MKEVERLNIRDKAEAKLINEIKKTGLNDNIISRLITILDFVTNDLNKSQAVIDYLQVLQKLQLDKEKNYEKELKEYASMMYQLGM